MGGKHGGDCDVTVIERVGLRGVEVEGSHRRPVVEQTEGEDAFDFRLGDGTRRERRPALLFGESSRLKYLVFSDGVDAGPLSGLRLDPVDDCRHFVARGGRGDGVPIDDRNPRMLATINGLHRQRHNSLQRGLGISFGDEDPGDGTELLCQLNIGGVCHCPTLVVDHGAAVLATPEQYAEVASGNRDVGRRVHDRLVRGRRALLSLCPDTRVGIGVWRRRPTNPFTGKTAGVLKFERDVALLNLQLGGDCFSQSLLDVDEPLALLRLVVEGWDPEDPTLTVPRHLGPKGLHARDVDTQL